MTRTYEVTGWLIELNSQPPTWAVINPDDYDEHWTADASKAIRFARKQDAQAYIDHIGWTDAFPTEHMWCDPRAISVHHPISAFAENARVPSVRGERT